MVRRVSGSSGTGDLDAARLQAWHLVRDVGQVVVDRVSRQIEETSGVTLDCYGLLLELHNAPARTLSQFELGRRSSLSQSGISRMLTRLEDAEIIRRTPSDRDRRNLDVRLTEYGIDVFLRATAVHRDAVQRQFGTWLSDGDCRHVSTALAKVLHGTDHGRTIPDRDDLDQLVTFGRGLLSTTSHTAVVRDAIATREALEPLILADAAAHHDASLVGALHAALGRMATLTNAPTEFFAQDWALHRLLADACRNDVLRRVYLNLLEIIANHVHEVVDTRDLSDYLRERLDVHTEIVSGVVSRDQDRVRAAAARHEFSNLSVHLLDAEHRKGIGRGTAPRPHN